MISVEKKALEFIEKNLYIFLIGFAFVLGLYLRFSMRYMISGDCEEYYLTWYQDIKNLGGIKAIGTQIGDYSILYQLCLALLTYLPIIPLYAMKAFSVFFDLLLAVLVAYLVGKNTSYEKKGAAAAFAFVWISPVVAMNSAMWTQCDSIYTFFAILSVYFLYKEKHVKSMVFLGLAFAFKLQTIFIVPFFLFIYFYKKRFSILYFLIAPLTMWITTIPGIIGGHKLLDGFTIFFVQKAEYYLMEMNYPGFWMFTSYETFVEKYDYFDWLYTAGIILTVIVLAAWMVYTIKEKAEMNAKNFIGLCLLLTYTMVFFCPVMHERYGYIYEIVAIIYLFYNRKSAIPCALLQIMSITTYAWYLMFIPRNLTLMAILNLGVYIWYAILYIRGIREEKNEEVSSLCKE
ncbi:MAG: glycosyltransferase 87 family protein [Lachnospiraceae bacterium]|nr:glycosyltransferase 87 family protein [Lachnospiraceae bacterium]